MNWDAIKQNTSEVYPKHSITIFTMNTETGKPATCWVDKGYKDYKYKKECMYNCFISVDLTNEFNAKKEGLDFADIEDFFTTKLREACICHIIARITTAKGLNIELYIDDVEKGIEKFNEIENDPGRLVNFDCEISDDEDWDNVSGLF